MSEWRNAVDRQVSLREANINHPPLVFPLCYNDFSEEDIAKLPDPLRDEVRGLQIALDFRNFTTLVNAQGDNERAMTFRDEVANLCEKRLWHSISGAPPVDETWPRLPAKPYTRDDWRWKSKL